MQKRTTAESMVILFMLVALLFVLDLFIYGVWGGNAMRAAIRFQAGFIVGFVFALIQKCK